MLTDCRWNSVPSCYRTEVPVFLFAVGQGSLSPLRSLPLFPAMLSFHGSSQHGCLLSFNLF